MTWKPRPLSSSGGSQVGPFRGGGEWFLLGRWLAELEMFGFFLRWCEFWVFSNGKRVVMFFLCVQCFFVGKGILMKWRKEVDTPSMSDPKRLADICGSKSLHLKTWFHDVPCFHLWDSMGTMLPALCPAV